MGKVIFKSSKRTLIWIMLVFFVNAFLVGTFQILP